MVWFLLQLGSPKSFIDIAMIFQRKNFISFIWCWSQFIDLRFEKESFQHVPCIVVDLLKVIGNVNMFKYISVDWAGKKKRKKLNETANSIKINRNVFVGLVDIDWLQFSCSSLSFNLSEDSKIRLLSLRKIARLISINAKQNEFWQS